MDEENQDSIGYAFKGKIMITSVVILFVACFIIVFFHVYGRWFRGPNLRHHNRRRRRRHHHLNASSTDINSSQGLGFSAMNSLPSFVYESKDQEFPLECAVCLSEFEDNEAGRILPECKHCFHVDCIDMWLKSHGDCPLCRAQVKVQPVRNPVEPIEDPAEGMVSVSINVSGNVDSESGSGLHPACQSEVIDMGSSSSSSRTPDVPRQSTISRGQDPTKNEVAPDPDVHIGSDIESGSKTPASSVRVLKRFLSI